jgi:hypothetical protein
VFIVLTPYDIPDNHVDNLFLKITAQDSHNCHWIPVVPLKRTAILEFIHNKRFSEEEGLLGEESAVLVEKKKTHDTDFADREESDDGCEV